MILFRNKRTIKFFQTKRKREKPDSIRENKVQETKSTRIQYLYNKKNPTQNNYKLFSH